MGVGRSMSRGVCGGVCELEAVVITLMPALF